MRACVKILRMFRSVLLATFAASAVFAQDQSAPTGASPLSLSEATLEHEIKEVRKQLDEAAKAGEGLDDAAMQEQVERVHALLWRFYFDPRTNMVYTILEPHTGKVVLPSREDVLKGVPNLNGWSTPIEDCAGYGNGRHLAWLVERWELTQRPEHAAEARKLLAGLLLLGTIRPADSTGFAELVRGVLPDGWTYYAGKGRGSSGDNYNGYSYGLWRYARSSLATTEERDRIAATLDRTCYRNAFGAFAAITADVTRKEAWCALYEKGRKGSERNFSSWTVASRLDAKSWTAVQLQLNLSALLFIEGDPPLRTVYAHAMRANAWSRWKDVLAGLTFDERRDDYMHRVETVRNPLDGMLTVMLTGDREIMSAFLPVFRRVAARYDFAAFRDQRQLTPFLGIYWLGVRHGALRHDSNMAPPSADEVKLKPPAPNRNLIVTYFRECNPERPK